MACTFSRTSAQYLTLPYNAVLAATNITLCAWVKPTNTTQQLRVVSQNVSGAARANEVYGLEVNAGACRMLLGMRNNLLNLGYGVDTVSGGTVPTTAWTHIAGTFDGANMRVYVNGVQVNVLARTAAMVADTTNPIAIGAIYQQATGISQYFDGGIEDVRIYNRALSANEIITLYTTRGADGNHFGNTLNIGMYEGSRGVILGANSSVKDVGPYGLNATSAISGVTFIETYIKNRRGHY